jgi:hypothetical protein
MVQRGEAMVKPCHVDEGLASRRAIHGEDSMMSPCLAPPAVARQAAAAPLQSIHGTRSGVVTPPECVLVRCRCRASQEDRGKSQGC